MSSSALSSPFHLVLLGIVLAGAGWTVAGCAGAEEPPPPASRLLPGAPVERELSGGEVHSYLVALEAGQSLHALARQRGTDVVLALLDPAGHELLTVDSPNGSRGPEHLFAVAERTGDYRLEIRPWSREGGGGYSLSVAEPRPATEDDRVRARAAGAVADGDQLAGQREAAARRRAIARYEEAMLLWRQVDEPYLLALTAVRLGRILARLGELQPAAESYEEALGLLRTLERDTELTSLRNDLGDAYRRLGRTAEARVTLEETLENARRHGDRREEAVAVNNLALLHKARGESWKALDLYEQALATFRELGDQRAEATALHNVGALYSWLDRLPEAHDALGQAFALRRDLGDERGQAVTLSALGWVELWAGEPRTARRTLEDALELRRALGDRLGEGVTRDRLGTVLLALDAPDEARDAYEAALILFREGGDRLSEAHTLDNLGDVLERRGDLPAALADHSAALELFTELDDPSGRAQALLAMARVQRRQGDLEAARTGLETALPVVESLRRDSWSGALRSSYFALVQQHYELLIDVLMELDRRQPQAGHVRRAFEVAERRRARSLLDLIAEARRVAEADRERERALGARIRALEAERRQRLAGGARAPTEPLDAELRRLLRERDKLRTGHTRTGRTAAPVAAEPLPFAEIERQVVDDETDLLVYSLGEERSFLWLVRPGEVTSRELPSRSEIEAGARRLHGLLATSHRPALADQTRLTAKAFSDVVLGPIAGELAIPPLDPPRGTAARRLLVVADGALQYVPFGVLPLGRTGQGAGPAPLLSTDHEVVLLPSASVLASLRRRRGERAAAPGLLAVLADPLFHAVQAEENAAVGSPGGLLGRDAGTAEVERSAGDLGFAYLPALPYTRREAEAILALASGGMASGGEASGGEVWRALGPAASREAALDGRLGRYRILHFATHALLHEQPELTGVVLSLFDEDGRPVDGFLRSYEIASLDLSADLVVLSACRTALGREVRGEGLVGLPRSFLAAGAARVVVSLWNVHDAATAELMTRFYRGLFEDHLTPAAALRTAQLSMREEERWRAPYYWAGFVLIGEAR